MIKDHDLVGRSKHSDLRHGKPTEIIRAGIASTLRPKVYFDNLSIKMVSHGHTVHRGIQLDLSSEIDY